VLHKVQKTAISRSDGKAGFGFIMEQGLGKTLTYATEFLEQVAADKVTRSVVICPNSFMLIVNYEAIRQERIQNMILDFVRNRSASICADESIQISTHNALQTKAAIMLSKEFEFRRILSGKWMKKGPHDFWSQLRFLGLIDGFRYFHWRNRFCTMGGFKGKQVVGAKNQAELAPHTGPPT
jgi:hypothetical protein